MRKIIVAVALAGAAGAALAAPGPARASTPVSFTVVGGGLSITSPTATAALTGGALTLAGSSASGQLGATTVTDLRGGLAGSWTVSVAGPAGGFTDGAGDTIATGAATMWVAATGYSASPLATSAVRTDTHLLQATGVPLSASAQTLLTATTTGTNTATFNPNVFVAIPNTAAAATYTGTITQTVS